MYGSDSVNDIQEIIEGEEGAETLNRDEDLSLGTDNLSSDRCLVPASADISSEEMSVTETNQGGSLGECRSETNNILVPEGTGVDNILEVVGPTNRNDAINDTTCDVSFDDPEQGIDNKKEGESTLSNETTETPDDIDTGPLIESCIPPSIGLQNGYEMPPLQMDPNQTKDENLEPAGAEGDTDTSSIDIEIEGNSEKISTTLKRVDYHDQAVTPTGCSYKISPQGLFWMFLAFTFLLVVLLPLFHRLFIVGVSIYRSIKLFFDSELTWSNIGKAFLMLLVFVLKNMYPNIEIQNFTVNILDFSFVYEQNEKSKYASKTTSDETTMKANLSKPPGFIFNFRDSNALHNAFVYPVSEPGDYYSMSEQGNLVCTCTDDLNDLQNSLMDTSLDHNSLEENDSNIPDRESQSPASLSESSNEQPNAANDTVIHIAMGDSGYISAPNSSLRGNSQRSDTSALSRPTNVVYGNVLQVPYDPTILVVDQDTLSKMRANQTLIFMLSIGNVKYGTNEDLIARLPSQKFGGIILDQRFAGYVEENRFERTRQYNISEELYHASLCITKKDRSKFIMKTVPRESLNFHQLQRYIMAAERIRSFVPRILGVLFDNSDIKILFSYRKGHSLEEMMQMGRFIEGLDFARFVSYLVEAVQTLHREGISLLSINPSSITLDDDYNLASFKFTNIQFTETSQQLSTDYPMYAPFGGAITGNTEDRKSYDMHSLGALSFFLLNEGRELWDGVNPAERHADNIYKRIISLDQTRHFVNPYVVHLILCLMNPNQHARLTAETVSQHVFFANENDAMTSLQLVNTHGHGCPYWVVTITDGSQVLYVTTAQDRSPLHEIFSDQRLREMIGHNPEQAWFTYVTQGNAIPIKSDMVIDIRMRN